jgi:1-acyl-sn-glycerol-3-phosphate acyltransferase
MMSNIRLVLAYLRAGLFWVGFILFTILATFLLLFTFPLTFRQRFYFSHIWNHLTLAWLKITCGLGHRIEGLENVPDEPVIFLCKHQSTWETIALQVHLPPMVWVLKRELLWVPIFGWGAGMLNPIAINRDNAKQAIQQLLDQGQKRLASGVNIMIFPEGTRTLPGKTGKYRIGGAMLAEKAGCPVVPIAHNAGYFWPRHQFVKRPGTIQVVIGKPIRPENKTASEILREAQDWIETTVEEIGRTGA